MIQSFLASALRGVGAFTLWLAIALVSSAQTPAGRVILLGFDGADARTELELMERGELPNLAALRAQGTFAPLATTMPAESPVSWASLNSGQNPAKTGIPGFVKRNLVGGVPMPALGHQTRDTRKSETFELGFLRGLLVRHDPAMLACAAGAIVLLVFLFLFGFLLKVRWSISAILSLLLGGIGAWGAYVSSTYIPREIAGVVGNPTHTEDLWDVAARAGVPCVVLDAAMAWDKPDAENLKLLAGLGVPDARSSNGDWFVYTTDDREFARAPEGRSTRTAGKVFRVDERDGKIQSYIYGPLDHWMIDKLQGEVREIDERLGRSGLSDKQADELQARKRAIQQEELPRLRAEGKSEEGRAALPLEIKLLPEKRAASVAIGGQSQEIAEGGWSKWYHLTFELNPLFKVHAITRVKLVKLQGPFELYVDFLQIDPANPTFWQPVSRPAGFARELSSSVGMPFETVGWACMTMPFKDREIDPVTFLEDIEFTHGWREKLAVAALQRSDWRVLVNIEATPDRVQHMMYQFYDEAHPMYDAAKAAQKTTYFGKEIALKDAIPATYRELDRFVGDVVKNHLKPGDTLIICADHGFQTFRRQVSLNNWLAQEGYLVLKSGLSRSDGDRSLAFVDWTKTRAYALGLGMVFLNLEGREKQGIVKRDEAPALLAEIKSKLLALEDPENHAKAVKEVYLMSEIHSGPYLDSEADLMPGFAASYRVSWGTTLGNIVLVESEDKQWVAGPVFEDNKNNWSGDHVSVAEDLVRGAFFCNRKVEIPAGGVNVLHIAPTVLSLVGVPIPKDLDLAPLRFLD